MKASNIIGKGRFSYLADTYIIQNAPTGPVANTTTNKAIMPRLLGIEGLTVIQNVAPVTINPKRVQNNSFMSNFLPSVGRDDSNCLFGLPYQN